MEYGEKMFCFADLHHSIRDRRWKQMSLEERSAYLATTKDKGNKRLDFRFAS